VCVCWLVAAYLFLCASFCQSPFLWLLGLLCSLLQSLLLALVWARAEENMYYEFFAHGLVNVSSTMSWREELHYRFPSVDVWKQLGRTGAAGEGIAAAGPAGGAAFEPLVDYSTGIERYHAMIDWSTNHAYLPKALTHPDLQARRLEGLDHSAHLQ
jgi:hypothetical protein